VEKELFGIALGIQEPIYIDEKAFDSASGELHIHMDFRRGGNGYRGRYAPDWSPSKILPG